MLSLLNEIKITQTGFLPDLISDYLNSKETISQLYKYPLSLSSFPDIIRDKAKDNTDRKLLVEVLREQYSNIETTDIVTRNIESFSSDKTFSVTTAHQPCLFLGPLYFLYKISSVINLTQQLKKEYPEYNFVPIFWLGSEDHDLDELNHAYVNGKRIDWKDAGHGAVGRLKTYSLNTVINELKQIAPNEEIISILEAGLNMYRTFGKFTQYFINSIFKEQGLVVIDQDDVSLKKKFAGIIKDEVLNSRAINVLKPQLDLLESNYKLQAKPRDINFFYLGENYRERIVYNDTALKFEVHGTAVSFTKEELIKEIDNHPERFSPNVIFRPLYQEMILPNMAFTGGAGELSYWLELKSLFDHYNINYPMQVLRNSAFIIQPAIHKKMEKLGLTVEVFFEGVEQSINLYVKDNMNPESHLDGERMKLEELFSSIAIKAETADPTLKQSVAAEKQKILASLENIESKIIKAEKRKQETSVAQIRAIHATLFPENTLQERRENFIPFYTTGFIAELVKHLIPLNETFVSFLNA